MAESLGNESASHIYEVLRQGQQILYQSAGLLAILLLTIGVMLFNFVLEPHWMWLDTTFEALIARTMADDVCLFVLYALHLWFYRYNRFVRVTPPPPRPTFPPP